MTRSAPPRTAARRLLAAGAMVALLGTGCANAPAETGSGGGETPASEKCDDVMRADRAPK